MEVILLTILLILQYGFYFFVGLEIKTSSPPVEAELSLAHIPMIDQERSLILFAFKNLSNLHCKSVSADLNNEIIISTAGAVCMRHARLLAKIRLSQRETNHSVILH